MVRLIALFISIALQIIAASIALRFMKITRYRLSWILLSTSFVLMAIRTFIQLVEYFRGKPSFELMMVDEWMNVLISVMIITGVVLIRELFYSLKRAETDRLRSERRLLNAIINTEETEKKRFAKDLHDGLGPLLSTVKMSLSALTPKVKDPVGVEILNNTSHVVNEALNTIKEISNNMSPHVLTNLGVASAISIFAAKVNSARSVTVDFRTNMEGERFDTDKEVVLYRVACELINNGMKHSGASKIEMDLNRHQKIITLQYLDNGRGFDTEKLSSEEAVGMGLPNIETRVRSVDGVFVIESSKGKGTSALIRVDQ
ncbi:MAG TPA: ATP-binding protein [Bacteroidales bacterium]|jgi:signal transduction histidine kinase|nr:histidine kinase [Bacteroidales bacterium]HWR75319.1 ATP-binding protein [Bacteroidales bacterium]